MGAGVWNCACAVNMPGILTMQTNDDDVCTVCLLMCVYPLTVNVCVCSAMLHGQRL